MTSEINISKEFQDIRDNDTTISPPSSVDEALEQRKLSAAKLRKARKAARNQRNRLLSDTTLQVPKGILKYPTRVRSVSECLDDVSKIEDDFALFDLTGEEANDENDVPRYRKSDCDTFNTTQGKPFATNDDENIDGTTKKKSVRFDERVYEASFFAAHLYNRRHFHFGTRHHPPQPSQKSKSKKNKNVGKGGDEVQIETSQNRLSKSQRSKQSKRDKKRSRSQSKSSDDATDTSSDDQGAGQDDYECPPCILDDDSVFSANIIGSKKSKHGRKDQRNLKGAMQTNLCSVDVSTEIQNSVAQSKSDQKPTRRVTIDSGYDSAEEDNQNWILVKGKK